MAKVVVDFSDIEKLVDNITRPELQTLANEVVKDSKDFISKGISPVLKERRFTAYAAQRANAISDYPRDNNTRKKFPGKKVRPVNLSLDNTYLSKLTGWVEGKQAMIGFRNPSKFITDLYEAHNLGMNTKNGVPQRKHLPVLSEGDQFNKTIQQKILKVGQAIVDKAINRLNKKT